MGAIGGLLGTAGGVSGTGIKGPQSVPIGSPVTQGQVDQSNAGVNSSLGGSNALLAALQGQGGAGNQSIISAQTNALQNQVGGLNGVGTQGLATQQQQGLNGAIAGLNGTGAMGTAMGQQTGLNSALAGAGGVGAQQNAIAGLQNVLAGQQGTADMYRNLAQGTGPNPAQAALNQSTGQNVANQAALMAGQRGAGANVGLLARQAAQQGANTQQQAVGQAATLQANQQIAGMQGLGAQQAAMGQTNQLMGGLGAGLVGQTQAGIGQLYGQGAGAVNQMQTGIGQLSGQGQAAVNQQAGLLNANAGIAQNQVGNLINATGQNIQGNIGNAGQQMNSMGGYNTNLVNQQGNINSANAGIAQTGMKGQQDLIGGVLQGLGAGAASAGGPPAAARGGYVGMAEGGDPMQPYPAPDGNGPLLAAPAALPGPVTTPPPGPQSSFGQFLAGGSTANYLAQQPVDTANKKDPEPLPDTGDSKLRKGAASFTRAAMMASKGGAVEHDMRSGGNVKASAPAEKAVAAGNSYKNDKIKALLSEGEVVLPRTVMESKDPTRSAADFVAKVLAKRGKK